jgi:hypothetical protein
VVGLDEEACVQRFMAAYQGSGQLKDDDASWIEFAENVGKNRPRDLDSAKRRLRWAGVALLVTLLAVLSWFVWHYVSDKLAADNRPHQSHSASTVIAVVSSTAITRQATFPNA